MKKNSIILSMVLFSASVAANASDNLNFSPLHHHSPAAKCFCDAWKAAKPTDDQDAAAKPLIDAVKEVAEKQKEAVEAAEADMHTAWTNHPVNQADVVAAETALKDAVTPIHDAFRDNGVEIINLLSESQHKDFSAKFEKCMKKGSNLIAE